MDDVLAGNLTDLARFQFIEIGSTSQHILDAVAARSVGRMQLGPIIPIQEVRVQKRFQIAPDLSFHKVNSWLIETLR